jgi:triosephosphate isomerase
MTPRFVIAGNWKLHHGPDDTRAFLESFSPSFPHGKIPQILLFPPYLSVCAAVELKDKGPKVEVGVQNIYWEPSGAFTGEISAPLARAAGATHTLVGHSERRHVFGETDADVSRKVVSAMDAGLVPVICVGETLDERRAGRVAEVILGQLEAVLPTIEERPEAQVLLAYEPVWAIGTGETATPADASQAHGVLRGRLTEVLGQDRAREIPILYGGSVKPGNARELLAAPDVDGVLVGGASLDPGSFSGIAEAVMDLPER